MKERPILFSAPMVCAILEDRKTQTRRIVKGMALDWLSNAKFTPEYVAMPENYFSPYGFAGDRLWVRETWGVGCRPDPHDGWRDGIEYRADVAYLDEHDLLPLNSACVPEDVDLDSYRRGWRPSIHMPRWASRLMLDVTAVRIERLQDISEGDAYREGCNFVCMRPDGEDCGTAIYGPHGFLSLWEEINGSGSWDANPWIWVIEFKRTEDQPCT